MKREWLRVSDLSVEIDNRKLLQHISFSLFSGETLAICGLRFVGKSVLARLLTGEPFPFTGDIYMDGVPYYPNRKAFPEKIFYIPETNNAFPFLSITDTLFAVRIPRKHKLFYRQKAARIQTEHLLKELGIDLSADMPSSELTNAQLHLLMIAKAQLMDARVVILDSITDNYTLEEYSALTRVMNKAKNIAFMYICNHEDSIVYQADRILMIRNGNPAALLYKNDYSSAQLMHILQGGKEIRFIRRSRAAQTEPVASLHLQTISAQELQFDVHTGEIIGVYDENGGNAENMIRDLIQNTPSCLQFSGCPRMDYANAVKSGLGIVTQNYPHDGYYAALSEEDNLAFQLYRKISTVGFIPGKITKYLQKTAYQEYYSSSSPGILEKVLLRWILAQPKLLILENILFGLDVTTRKNIYEILDRAARDGIAIIIISTNYGDLDNFCERTIIL